MGKGRFKTQQRATDAGIIDDNALFVPRMLGGLMSIHHVAQGRMMAKDRDLDGNKMT